MSRGDVPGMGIPHSAARSDADEVLTPAARPTRWIEAHERYRLRGEIGAFCETAPLVEVARMADRIKPSAIPLVYIAGPYSGPDGWEIACNVHEAEKLARACTRLGVAPLTPHSIGARMAGTETQTFWLAATLEMMRRCDAVLFTADWQRSAGARGEYDEAIKIGLPIFYGLASLAAWREDAGPTRSELRAMASPETRTLLQAVERLRAGEASEAESLEALQAYVRAVTP